MKFGVREICDVVLKAKSIQKIGNRVFYKDEPVLYFDSLKTSSLEGAATTVYAQGGRGNSRLIAWEGERTVTFTMEDALLSAESFSILSGANIIKAGDQDTIKIHTSEETAAIEYCAPANSTKFFRMCNAGNKIIDKEGTSSNKQVDPNKTYFYRTQEVGSYFVEAVGHPEHFVIGNVHYWHEKGDAEDSSTAKTYYTHTWTYATSDNTYKTNAQLCIYLSELPFVPLSSAVDKYAGDKYIYIFRTKDHECISEPFYHYMVPYESIVYMDDPSLLTLDEEHPERYNPDIYGKYRIILTTAQLNSQSYYIPIDDFNKTFLKNTANPGETPVYEWDNECTVLVDYYVERTAGHKINIISSKFGSNFYLEGSTLFRTTDGVDLPAKIIIPNCKIQSNFTITMASSGDPSTFTFTMDAFPDYVNFDKKKKKVLTAIQIIDPNNSDELSERTETAGSGDFMTIAAAAVRNKTWSDKQPKET